MQAATPTYSDPPDICPLCFGVNQTPDYVLIFFSGIQIGDLWGPADPPSPNGLHIADNFAPCHFEDRALDWNIAYRFVGGRTHCDLSHDVAGPAFSNNLPDVCHIWCPNEIVNPAISKFYGGQCIVMSPLIGNYWDYPELLSLMADDPNWATYLNARSAAGMNVFYNLYKGNSQVNVKIKIDHS